MQNQSSFQVYNASAGSGKTFTLVKEYLKILLKSDNQFIYQNILAITFTNKAASEMKERVLKNLLDFSRGDSSNDMLQLIIEEENLDIAIIQQKAKTILHSILRNYSAFHIKTIDSFTSKLIKSFAFDLGLTLDFEVELDPQSILEETVDVIISKIGIDKELTDVLVEFAKRKTLEDKSWDISRELKEISILLLKENDALEIKKITNKSISDFKLLEKKIRQRQIESEKLFVKIGEKGLEIIDNLGIDYKDFYYSDLPNFFKKLIRFKNIKSGDLKFEGRLFKSVNEGVLYGPKKSQDIKSIIDSVSSQLIELYFKAEKLYDREYGTYQLDKLILKNLIPLAILNSIAQALDEIKIDNNIRLIGEFNQIISEHLREQPAAFIYEKIGERYKHYFIDEMQDTSVLQWENLMPLMDNALSEENSGLLLVGDAKQAIYRWRGGEAEQFITLSSDEVSKDKNPFQSEKLIKNLDTNFRSNSEIVDFNNQFFSHISKYFKNDDYQKLYKLGNHQKNLKKNGGYVRLDFVDECKNLEERDRIFPERVYEIIQNLGDQFDKNEICVLVRKKAQGITIANYLNEKGIQIVSSETLLIKNNNKVDFIIQLLRFFKDENDGESRLNILYFLYDYVNIEIDRNEFIDGLVHLSHLNFFKELEKYQIIYDPQNFGHTPFYESIEEIIRCFNLAKESDGYLQFFMDFVFEFSTRKSQNNVDFLEYWDLKKDKLSVIASNGSNAVQIMTIHKSKGLEFPVVIYPYDLDIYYQKDPKYWYSNLDEIKYNNFESILISSSSAIQNIGKEGKEIFDKQQGELELDNFNLLYVTLTRAKEQLYIVSENKTVKEKLKSYAHFFIDFLKESQIWIDGKTRYEFGNPHRISNRETNNTSVEIQKELISTSWQDHQFNIVANSSLLWDSERGDAIKFGNIIHELMSRIISKKDIHKNILRYANEGLIEKDEQEEIEKLILEIVNHKELELYYQSDKTIFTEREILTNDHQILIPDRLIFGDENKVTIIDYKTGIAESKHHNQIEKYAKVLIDMNFKIEKKILVYIDDIIKVEYV